MKFKITKAEFDALDDAQKALYKAKGDDYQLAVEGMPEPEDVTGLKNKIDELLGEKKTAAQKLKDAEKLAADEREKKLKDDKNFEELYNSSEIARGELQKQLDGVKADGIKTTIRGEATKLAQTLTKDVNRAKLLADQFEGRLQLVDGSIKVTDEGGNLTVSTVEELTNSVKKAYPFLVDGSKATGGGAQGNESGANDSKTVTRSEFEQMSHADRGAFAKDKGKVVED